MDAYLGKKIEMNLGYISQNDRLHAREMRVQWFRNLGRTGGEELLRPLRLALNSLALGGLRPALNSLCPALGSLRVRTAFGADVTPRNFVVIEA